MPAYEYLRGWLLESTPVDLSTFSYGEMRTGEFVGYYATNRKLEPGTPLTPHNIVPGMNKYWVFVEEFVEYIHSEQPMTSKMHGNRPSRLGSLTVAATPEDAKFWGRNRAFYQDSSCLGEG